MNVVPTRQKAQQEPPAETTTPGSKSKGLVTDIEATTRLQLEPFTRRSWRRCGIGRVYTMCGPAKKATVRP